MNFINLAIGLLVGGAAVFGYFQVGKKKRSKKLDAQNQKKIDEARKHLRELERKGETIETKIREKILDAKKKALEISEEAKKDEREIRKSLEKHEARIITKEEGLEKKASEAEKAKDEYAKKTEALKIEEEKLEAIYKEQEEALSKLTKLSKEDAKKMLLDNIEREYKDDLVKHYKNIENDVKDSADKVGKNLIVQAIQKYASTVTSEATQTLVDLPNDDLKGRIIGREGRNINAFEHLTGVDVIVDETPGAVVISGFDLVRRFVAKRSMEKLIEDGRIQPARIEQIVNETKTEVNEMMKDFGERATYEIGVTGLHPDLIKIIGRLRFRTSFGQNVLKHSLEVGYLAAGIAAEVGADVNVAKLGGFLHDIGKAVDHEIEGSHALIGRDIAKKYGLSEAVIHCIEAHHEEVPVNSAEALIVQAADAISASRPGARRETVTTYIKRLQDLENLGNSFEGVEKTYAIQAGREIRIFVNADKIDDLKAIQLSHDVARKIEKELSYPGTVRVNIIRELRAIDVAR